MAAPLAPRAGLRFPGGSGWCQWAWELLRRDPDHAEEWAAFISIWRSMDAAYGRPPEADIGPALSVSLTDLQSLRAEAWHLVIGDAGKAFSARWTSWLLSSG